MSHHFLSPKSNYFQIYNEQSNCVISETLQVFLNKSFLRVVDNNVISDLADQRGEF